MEADFVQFYNIVTGMRSSTEYYTLNNGFGYISSEVPITWVRWTGIDGTQFTPKSKKAYISTFYQPQLLGVLKLARENPETEFVVGGPAVWPTCISSFMKDVEWPSNFRVQFGLAEEIIGREPDPKTWTLSFPYTDRKRVYSYYFGNVCDWGKCSFCVHSKDWDKDTRPIDLEPLFSAPEGVVFLATPSVSPQKLDLINKLDYSNKSYQFYLRGSEQIYQKLISMEFEHPESLHVRIGVEFPSNRMLSSMKKGVTLDSLIRVINWCYHKGCWLTLSYIFRWGCLIPSDLEEAQWFFDQLDDVNDEKTLHGIRRLVVHTPSSIPVKMICGMEAKSLVGYFIEQSTEQQKLDDQWLSLLKSRITKYCDFQKVSVGGALE